MLLGAGHGQLKGVAMPALHHFRGELDLDLLFAGADLLTPTEVLLGFGVHVVCGGVEQWWWWSPRGKRGAVWAGSDAEALGWSCGGRCMLRSLRRAPVLPDPALWVTGCSGSGRGVVGRELSRSGVIVVFGAGARRLWVCRQSRSGWILP